MAGPRGVDAKGAERIRFKSVEIQPDSVLLRLGPNNCFLTSPDHFHRPPLAQTHPEKFPYKKRQQSGPTADREHAQPAAECLPAGE
jgi:hypothetical protein